MSDLKRKIEINELPKKVPDYKNSDKAKDILTEQWLTDWITNGIKTKKLKAGELLPVKSKLAYYLGVSIGTVQSAIRYMEDKKIVESKQKIGTYIKSDKDNYSIPQKLTGKRDLAIKKLIKYILENNLKQNDKLPSIRMISKMLDLSTNTVRLSIEHLIRNDILESINDKKDTYIIVKNIPNKKYSENIEMKTLTSKIEDEILKYLQEEFKVGDKFLTHHQLAKKFNVSVKTTHDAVKSLMEKGYLVARRGQYGTVVTKTNEKQTLQPKPETTIFAPAAQAAIYRYEKIESQLKKMITEDFALGTKLPSMQALAEKLDVSTNTIKKALHNLAKQGYLGFSRGRYGGSFVINVPEEEETTAFRWLAVSKKYVNVQVLNDRIN